MFEFFFKYPQEIYAAGDLLLMNQLLVRYWLYAALIATVLLWLSAQFGRRTHELRVWQKSVLVSLQFLVLALIAVLLANPTLQIEALKPGINRVVVLVDESRSMQFPASQEAESTSSRLDVAAELVAELTAALNPAVQVQLYGFAEGARRIADAGSLTGTGTASRLLQSLNDVLTANQDSPLAAVVVISDGAITGENSELAQFPVAGVPVHTIGIGATALSAETILEDVMLPVEVPVRSSVQATFVLRQAQAQNALVRILDRGRLVAAERVALAPEQEVVRVAVNFDSGSAGVRDLSFEVLPEGRDTLAENNRLNRLLTVSERSRTALYLEGEPRWEYKFLRRALAADDVVTVKSMLKTTGRKSYRQGITDPAELSSGLPETRENLYRYDLVVLGSLAAAELSAEQHALLEEFVSVRGGSLLVLAGRNALMEGGWQDKPLAALLPVKLSAQPYGPRRGSARVSAAGALSAITRLPSGEGGDAWQTLPELADYQPLGSLKPGATTLLNFAESDSKTVLPLLVRQPYGLGNVAVLASASTWRWQTRTPETDSRHQRFWRQLIRALAEDAPQPTEVTISAGRDSLALRLMLRDAEFAPRTTAGVSARLSTASGAAMDLTLQATSLSGEYLARVNGLDDGIHRIDVQLADDSSVTRFARTGGDDAEFREPLQNSALLQHIATRSGGRYWNNETATSIADSLNYASAGVLERRLLPLWDSPALLLLLVLLKSGEWLLRRRWRRI